MKYLFVGVVLIVFSTQLLLARRARKLHDICRLRGKIPRHDKHHTWHGNRNYSHTFNITQYLDEMTNAIKADWHDQESYQKENLTAGAMNILRNNYFGHRRRHRRAGERNEKRMRKEYRQMTDDERCAFHDALGKMKHTMIDGIAIFDIFALQHVFMAAPAAHGGCAFCPWHRVCIRRFETALRIFNPSLHLPYWDSGLDDLPDPTDSCIFDETFMGSASGRVTTGVAANWTVVVEPCRQISTILFRDAVDLNALLFHDGKFDYFSSMTSFADLCRQTRGSFEAAHGNLHTFIGGHMGSLNCAANDPLFWMHHTFIDLVFEYVRRNQGTPIYPERTPPYHGAYEPMLPFSPLLNIAGLLDDPDILDYYYSPRSVLCDENTDCAPSALWCDSGRCRSKIRIGGTCLDQPDSCCYDTCKPDQVPKCFRGKCVCEERRNQHGSENKDDLNDAFEDKD